MSGSHINEKMYSWLNSKFTVDPRYIHIVIRQVHTKAVPSYRKHILTLGLPQIYHGTKNIPFRLAVDTPWIYRIFQHIYFN